MTGIDPSGQQNWEEFKADVSDVGLYNAWKAYKASEAAGQRAGKSGLTGQRNGPQDAFRHCLWLCLMAKSIGTDNARLIGQNHEKHGEANKAENQMDLSNNEQGIMCAVEGKDCFDCCLDKVSTGRLVHLPGSINVKAPPGSPPPVPTGSGGGATPSKPPYYPVYYGLLYGQYYFEDRERPATATRYNYEDKTKPPVRPEEKKKEDPCKYRSGYEKR